MMHWVLPLLMSAASGAPASSAAAAHFEVSAEFRPARAPGTGEVAVTFAAKDPDFKVNTRPAPRLKLDADQKILADKPGARPDAGPEEAMYLDTTFPVVFPVAVVERPRSAATVKGSLTYYYCSQRQGWCRKGTALLTIPVKAR